MSRPTGKRASVKARKAAKRRILRARSAEIERQFVVALFYIEFKVRRFFAAYESMAEFAAAHPFPLPRAQEKDA